MGLGPCFCGSYSGLDYRCAGAFGKRIEIGLFHGQGWTDAIFIFKSQRQWRSKESCGLRVDRRWTDRRIRSHRQDSGAVQHRYIVGLFHGFTYGYSTEKKSTGTEKGLQDAIGTFRTGDVHGAVRFPGVPAGSSDMGGLRHMVLLRNDSLFPLRQETQ